MTNHFGMVFVDLSRFRPPEGGPENLLDLASAWCYFISGSASLSGRDRAALFQINEVFKVADAILKDLSVEGEVRILEKLREKQLHDQVSDLNYARQEGRQEGRREFILNMLKEKFDVSAVSKVTGLSEAEILAERERAEKLRKNGKTD